jgi:tetratricopeptide (TPR) repeat protein
MTPSWSTPPSAAHVRGRIDQAAQLAPQILAAKPGDGLPNLVLAVQSIKKGDYKAAETPAWPHWRRQSARPIARVCARVAEGRREGLCRRPCADHQAEARGGERAEAPALVIEAQIDEMAGDKAAAEAKYRRAMALDKNGLRTTVAVAEGLMRLGKTAEARDLLKTYGEKYSDAVVMDGLIAPNAPTPPQPTPASGISEILFDIGGIMSADPRNARADLALIFYQLAAYLRPEHDFAWLMIAGLYEQFQMVPKAVEALNKIGQNSPLYWQARLRVCRTRRPGGEVRSGGQPSEDPDRREARSHRCRPDPGRPAAGQGKVQRRRAGL